MTQTPWASQRSVFSALERCPRPDWTLLQALTFTLG